MFWGKLDDGAMAPDGLKAGNLGIGRFVDPTSYRTQGHVKALLERT